MPSRLTRRSGRRSAETDRRPASDPPKPGRRTNPLAASHGTLGNVPVVIGAVLDGMVEDCRIRGQPGHRKFLDVALERAAVHEVAGDIVEPEALTEVVQCLRRFHRVDSGLDARMGAVNRGCGRSPSSKSAISSIVTSAGEKASSIVGSCA
jgi:hypothetical protein